MKIALFEKPTVLNLNQRPNMIVLTDSRRIFEISAAIVTGIGKLLFVDWLGLNLYFIVTVCLFWATYVSWRVKESTLNLSYWGFTRTHLKSTCRRLLPLALIAVTGFLIYGFYYDTIIWSWHIWVLLILYPIWGVLQQYLVVGLVAGNLEGLRRLTMPKWLIVIITSVLFPLCTCLLYCLRLVLLY